MNWFKNLPIARKLAVGFTLTTLMTLILGLFALLRMSEANNQLQQMSSNDIPSVQHLAEARSQLGEFRTYEMAQLTLLDDPEKVTDYNKRMADTRKLINDELTAYAALPAGDKEKELFTVVQSKLKLYFDANSDIAAAIASGDNVGAQQVSDDRSRPARRELFAALKDLGALTASLMQEKIAVSNTTYERSVTAVIGSIVLLTLLASVMGWLIARAVTVPLSQALNAVRAVARGDLSVQARATSTDEPGQMLAATGEMTTMLRRFSSETSTMAEQHAGPDMSHRIPEDFPGVYGELAKGINTMIFEHLEAIVDAIAVLNEYATGDLSRDARRLPQSRAILHESMDAAKASLLAINTQIQDLAAAAAAGDFSQRGDAQRFSNDFRVMIETLNRMMDVSDGNLQQLSRLLQAIADGDLTVRMQGDFHGVFASMRDDANETVSQLTSIVGRIQHAAGSINTAASEIATGNNDLSRRTEQQAANLEETAASMEELTSTVRQNAEHARQANQLAIGAGAVAAQGGDVVEQVVTTMGGIEASSKKIAEIISVIDGIAFQTNILALNAAVEAARAGEQGRGFAVVASEVRTLAQRSAAAAKEIKDLIADSVSKVADGSALVHKAGTTMAEIVASVQRVTDIMGEISAASQEQTAGIEQVNQTVMQMDETTQQNAALVEEATAAARSMEEQATQLAEAVSQFRLAGQSAGSSATPASPVRSAAATHAPAAAVASVPAAATAPAKRSPAKPVAAKPAAPAKKVPALVDDAGDWQEF